ncbi:MAG: GGGtGRT protein [Oscillospiraceae bacterium]
MRSSKASSPSAFENACWAYTVGTAIALKKGVQDCRRGCRDAIGDGPAGVLHPRLRG